MNEWLHNLPVRWMALLIFAGTYLAAGGIFAIVMALAKGERVRAFKSVSSGLLSPLGTIFGLLVVFVVVQVWGDMDRARVAVDREASALRMVVLLAASFPGEPEAQIRNLLRRHIDEAVFVEWPEMAKQSVSLKVSPPMLAEALQLVLSLAPKSEGEIAAHGDPQTVHVTVGQTLYFCNFMNPVSWVWEVAEDQDGARHSVSRLKQQN